MTDIADVRLLANDNVKYDWYNTGTEDYLYSDAEIGSFLRLADGSVYMAAAMVVRNMALNEAFVLKKIRTDDLSTDGQAVARALQDLAGRLEQQAKDNAKEENVFMRVDLYA